MMRFLLPPITAALFMAPSATKADGVRPTRFGPFLQQSLAFEASPAGWRNLPPIGAYDFQAGWMEPIGFLHGWIFRGAFLETRGNATVSPYASDLGTAFNLKPIRFLEMGLGYNRLLFHNSLVGFDTMPDASQWRSEKILRSSDREMAGADVFTYQGSVTVDLARLQLHAGGFRNLWDVDVQDREFVFEYGSGLLIKKRDRVNSLYSQVFLNLEPYLDGWGFSLRGIKVREQYWWTSQTHLNQNLVSGGFAGLRLGKNSDRRALGLDGMIGYWTRHNQLQGQDAWQHWYANLEWTWNIQVLHLGED